MKRILRALEVEATLGRSFLRRDGFALVTALFSIVAVGMALTGGFYSMFQTSVQRRAVEGASVLAQEALRAFARQTTVEELSRIEPGRDTVVTRVRIVTAESIAGAYTVLVGRPDRSTFTIESTGRLETPRGPVTCRVDVRWSPTGPADGLRLPPAVRPLCNRQAPPTAFGLRTHEVES